MEYIYRIIVPIISSILVSLYVSYKRTEILVALILWCVIAIIAAITIVDKNDD